MTLDQAKEQLDKYAGLLDGMAMQNDARSRVAFACFSIARQHFVAIVTLLDQANPLAATAFALLRPLLEATMRGQWVLDCATDDQVKAFVIGGKPQLDMVSVLSAIERRNAVPDLVKVIYRDNWRAASSYTHCYDEAIKHWLVEDQPLPHYSEPQLAWLLNAATGCFRVGITSLQTLKAKEEPSSSP